MMAAMRIGRWVWGAGLFAGACAVGIAVTNPFPEALEDLTGIVDEQPNLVFSSSSNGAADIPVNPPAAQRDQRYLALDEQTKGRYLSIIGEETQKLEELIGDLLDLARL